jgi:formylglycine-generating enzyme required for sulfatase activity
MIIRINKMKATLIVVILLGMSVPFSARGPQGALPERIVHRESGITLVLIPAGRFQMGFPANETGRGRGETQHWRVIKEPFYIGETEVTVEQFRRFAS